MTQVLFALARYQQSRAILEALQQHRSFSHVWFEPRRWSGPLRLVGFTRWFA